jgi:hypothetical protein
MKRILLATGLFLGLALPASAQINLVPQIGLTTGYLPHTTYSSAFFGLVPPASATDMVCIAGSTSKTVRVQRIVIGGTAATLVGLPIQVVRRASLDTGGTIGTTTANPGITTQIAKRDTTTGAATATLVSYTAVPTINDTAPTYLDSSLLLLNTTAAATNPLMTIFDWSRDIENQLQVPSIQPAATVVQQICVNFGAVSITTGALNGQITWTEE